MNAVIKTSLPVVGTIKKKEFNHQRAKMLHDFGDSKTSYTIPDIGVALPASVNSNFYAPGQGNNLAMEPSAPAIFNNDGAFEQQEDVLEIQSDPDSESEITTPSKLLQSQFDMLRFFCVIIFQISLCLTIAYYRCSNFASKYLLEMFLMFLIARPVFIVLYSWAITGMNVH